MSMNPEDKILITLATAAIAGTVVYQSVTAIEAFNQGSGQPPPPAETRSSGFSGE